MSSENGVEEVVVVGSGPAGWTAAIYTARANLRPLVIEGEFESTVKQPGGQLMLTSDVENYPGFPKGITGPEMMRLFREQAERFGARVESAWVTKVELRRHPLRVWMGEREVRAKTVILSTGSSAKWLGLESEEALFGRGVSACATCDGAFFKNKEIAVVGGGDSALEEALFLTRFASKVTVIHRRDELRASKIMQDRARKNAKIAFVWDTVVADVMDPAQKRVTGLRLKNLKTDVVSDFRVDGLFVAIGHEPNTSLFRGQVELDEKGYVKTRDGTRTNLPGVFAAGDVQDHIYRQAVTAAGSGCMAAIDAERWLESDEARSLIGG
jgi:thioredoxin reductase (NADPH)